MPIYCNSCGRIVPDDANICPYCTSTIQKHQTMQNQQSIYPPEQGNDRSTLFIIIMIALITMLIIAVSIVTYYYLPIYNGRSDYFYTPYISLTADPSTGLFSNEVEIIVTSIDDSDVSWSDVRLEISDSDDFNLDEYNEYVITSVQSGYIKAGDRVTIRSINDGLKSNEEYSYYMIYEPTGAIMGTVTWTQ